MPLGLTLSMLGCRDQGKLDESGLGGRVVDALRGFAIVGGLGPENIGDEGLRIAVVEREPTGLDLYHDAVTRQEDVIGIGKIEAVKERLVGGDGLGSFEAFAIPAAKNVGGDHQLVAAEVGLAGDFVWVDVDELDDPVGIGAGGGGDQIGDRLAGNFYG